MRECVSDYVDCCSYLNSSTIRRTAPLGHSEIFVVSIPAVCLLQKFGYFPFDLLADSSYNDGMDSGGPNRQFFPTLQLAADARLCQPDYANDIIWELVPSGGEPVSLLLQSTLGLRARSMRLFPRFTCNNSSLIDPATYDTQPRLIKVFPNYISLEYKPFASLEVMAEYWVPESLTVCGRITVTNRGSQPENLGAEWISLLTPLEEGRSMAVTQFGMNNVLEGETSDLTLVCYLSGGAQPGTGPFPGLAVQIEILPGESHRLTWAVAARPDAEASFKAARAATARPWDAEVAQIERLNDAQWLEIITGDADWNAAFSLSQKIAWTLFYPGNKRLPFHSFVLNRQPDQGFSPRGDGSDYAYQWNGQSALDAYYLNSLILPGGTDLAEGILRNFLSTQDENGFVEWKPGLAGQRSRLLSQPVLATLACQIDRYKTEHTWLAEIFPLLLRFFKVWFQPDHDRDGDGFPEWDHPVQSGAEDAPVYDCWNAHSQGMNISRLESPSLGAFLYRECQSLIKIARSVGNEEALPWLNERLIILRQAVNSCWNSRASTYLYRDFQTHLSLPSQAIFEFSQAGDYKFKKTFKKPQRLLLRLTAPVEKTLIAGMTIYGKSAIGELIEENIPDRLPWANGLARYTSRNYFSEITRLNVKRMTAEGKGALATPDYTLEDMTLLLPLWAGLPTGDQTKKLVEKTLLKRYLLPFGIPCCPDLLESAQPGNQLLVSLPWNQLIIEGLVDNGYVHEAADIFTRLMNGILSSLRQNGVFRECYNAQTGQPFGETNILRGLPSLGLFLQVLGIKSIQPEQVILQGFNPFSWPVTVKYHGITITRHPKDTVVTFPGGQAITVNGPGPHRVTLS
jgi:hypothetical protein